MVRVIVTDPFGNVVYKVTGLGIEQAKRIKTNLEFKIEKFPRGSLVSIK